MKVIGMLGGMSWESTTGYYQLANEYIRDHLGGLHSAKILLDSVDFAEIAALQTQGDWEEAGRVLGEHAHRLELAGADMIVICTNTMHKVVEVVQRAVDIPVLHIADATARAIKAAKLSRVGLLGTAFTMEDGFYVNRLREQGIDVLTPEPDQRALVHRVIFDELVVGVTCDESRSAYQDVIKALVAKGAEGIVLGCTEIESLISQDDSPVPVFPTARIHAEEAAELALVD